VLLLLTSTDAGAKPLVWNTGIWGDDWQTQPTSSNDSDGDGIVDISDVFPQNNAEWGDFDGDNIGDNSDIDDDNDGIDDYPDTDDDNDGLPDLLEISVGTNPLNTDSDDDGVTDGDEYTLGRNPRINEGIVIQIIQTPDD